MFDLPLAKKPRLRLHFDEKFLLGHCGIVRHILKITDRLYCAPISPGAYDASQKDDGSSYEKHPTCQVMPRSTEDSCEAMIAKPNKNPIAPEMMNLRQGLRLEYRPFGMLT
jgi:hypothetical protein